MDEIDEAIIREGGMPEVERKNIRPAEEIITTQVKTFTFMGVVISATFEEGQFMGFTRVQV